MPASLSSLISVPAGDLSAALPAGGSASGRCLREWLVVVPGPRAVAERWHPLEYVLALAVCAFTAAGHDSPSAIAEWAAGCPREALLVLGARPSPLTGRAWPPSARTFSHVLAAIDAAALDQALCGFVAAMPASPPGELPAVARHEREQRRAAAQARKPGVPGLLPQAAADGKAVRGAVRPDGTRPHLLSALHVGEGRTMAQREVNAKTNEIPELVPLLEGLDICGMVISADALHGQRDTAQKITAMGGHYIQAIKGNQPSLLAAITARLAGTDDQFPGWTEEGKGHGRRKRRSIRTAPAGDLDWPGAAQAFRIRRDTGPASGHWQSREFAFGITSLPEDLAGPRQVAAYARQHWAIDNKAHYVRDVTFREDAQRARTGSLPAALASIRSLAIGAFRKKGHANTAAARRYYGRDDQHILTLYGYA